MMNECYASDGEDHIFLMGGKKYSLDDCGLYENSDYSYSVYYFQIYEVSTNSWKKGPSLNWGLDGMACEVSSATQRIYTFGGGGKDYIQSIGLDLSTFQNK